ncbi:MAG: hypothetical protein V3V67_06325 [Myxococcota bacterium]
MLLTALAGLVLGRPWPDAWILLGVLAGGAFVGPILRAIRSETAAADRQVFRVSIASLSVLSVVMLLELALRCPVRPWRPRPRARAAQRCGRGSRPSGL